VYRLVNGEAYPERMLRKALLPALLIAAALAGCTSANGSGPATAASTTASAAPSPTPTVHTMSTAEAGKYYLAAVCPANKAQAANNAAFAAQDLGAIQSTAAVARDAYRAQAAAFTKTDVLWPNVVSAADLKLLTDADFVIISTYEAMSTAATLDSANAISNGFVDNGAGAAAQRIRLALALPADTSVGC
jgi:hypothetical protein